jgi:hypothetical protein
MLKHALEAHVKKQPKEARKKRTDGTGLPPHGQSGDGIPCLSVGAGVAHSPFFDQRRDKKFLIGNAYVMLVSTATVFDTSQACTFCEKVTRFDQYEDERAQTSV